MPLSRDQALALLKEDANKPRGGGTRTKADPTLVRESTTWFKLSHRIREEGCENPNCNDPRRGTDDKGVNVVVYIKDKAICRYCFLDGWLLVDDTITGS